MLTSVLQESQGLTIHAFVMLPLAMISLHMLTFRLMFTMVADFWSLVILLHITAKTNVMVILTQSVYLSCMYHVIDNLMAVEQTLRGEPKGTYHRPID